MKYLYGASVQGIQNFIFETNKLREIVGASDMVEQICTSLFAEQLGNKNTNLSLDENVLVAAAGHIRYVFQKKEECEKVVFEFPRRIMEFAPGINVSQAVVEIEDEIDESHLNKLNERITTQRAIPISNHGLGLMVSERARRTGKPGIHRKGKEVIDSAQMKKEEVYKESKNTLLEKLVGKEAQIKPNQFPHDISEIVTGNEKSWIAIIHADGNNLGKIIQSISGQDNIKNLKNVLREFSKLIEECTIGAANEAFKKIIKPEVSKSNILPLRPIILGGDDLTLIIRGDLAVSFSKVYLESFEELSKNKFKGLVTEHNLDILKDGLTACAGIAFIKPNYPFHYGVNLAESLCSYTKKQVKLTFDSKTPSGLTFHKVQDSFIESYDEIMKRELTAGSVSFNYGPYLIGKGNDKSPSLENLEKMVSDLIREDSPRSSLRTWLSELYVSKESAEQKMKRIRNIHPRFVESLMLDHAINEKNRTHIHDILSLASIVK